MGLGKFDRYFAHAYSLSFHLFTDLVALLRVLALGLLVDSAQAAMVHPAASDPVVLEALDPQVHSDLAVLKASGPRVVSDLVGLEL